MFLIAFAYESNSSNVSAENCNYYMLEILTNLTKDVLSELESMKIREAERDRMISMNGKGVTDMLVQNERLEKNVENINTVLTGELPGKTAERAASSCKSINSHHYGLKSGWYWLKGEAEPKLTHCEMNHDGIPDITGLPHCPKFVEGDGQDPSGDTYNEVTAGTFAKPEDCISACIEKAKNEPAFNGVSIRDNELCRCKRTVVSTSRTEASVRRYKTCVFRYSDGVTSIASYNPAN